MPGQQFRLVSTVDTDKMADLIQRYGEERYQAGVARRDDFTADEHAARLEVASATFAELLRLLFVTTTTEAVNVPAAPTVVPIRSDHA